MKRRKFLISGVNGIAGLPLMSMGLSNFVIHTQNSIITHGLNKNKNTSDMLEIPQLMNMGFHYTKQYSRRSRVNVIGLVDQSTEEWERWYHKIHKKEALVKMANSGYKIIEIHFMYGFGIEGEKHEYDLTKKMVENAHEVGIKVLGYFQFFSVQKELFFIENPWAKDCMQVKADGTPHTWAYDRPALCFTHEQVKNYYLKGVEIGLKYCGLDGIRLDNDYYRGCFCGNCQKEFKIYLKNKFSAEEGERVFGYAQYDEMDLVPVDLSTRSTITDPLYAEMVKFRMLQRQKIMNLIKDKITSVKPDAILGGNPTLSRTPYDSSSRNLYAPDLGKTHDLVCAENSLFPARTGDSVRHQIIAYKYGDANGFKVFPSHHLYSENGKIRWPENKEECALSLCEALAFGGHVPCTTWGIRMDGMEDKTLYERPHFLAALTPLKDFLNLHGDIYKDSESAAEVGIYLNRETHISDSHAYWYSLQGMVQLLIRHKIPFRFVDTDEDQKLQGLKLLLIGNVRLVSDIQLERFKEFAKNNKIIVTGEALYYDEYYLKRDTTYVNNFLNNSNVIHLKDRPEKILPSGVTYHGRNYNTISFPPDGDEFMESLCKVYDNPIKVDSSPFVAIDVVKNSSNNLYLHFLNYDNSAPQDVHVELTGKWDVELISPRDFGCDALEVHPNGGKTPMKLVNMHTYCVIKAMRKI